MTREPGDARRRRRAGLGAVAGLALVLGGCGLQGGGPTALATPDAASPRAASPIGVKTVRPTAQSDVDEAPGSGILAPQQIFDFHPPGSRADAWRQPFLIDPNDGPLANEVRRSAAELKAFLAESKAPPRTASPRRCGETDVAQATPGCTAKPPARRPTGAGASAAEP